ncbi:hypothetical protein PFISCL1PPCAC_2515, partial [Pristionchus fissidentatus]
LGSVQHESEALEEARVLARSLESCDESPLAGRILSPGVSGHKGPVGEAVLAVVILGTTRENHRSGARGCLEVEGSISTAGRVEGDDGLHVLEVRDLRGRDCIDMTQSDDDGSKNVNNSLLPVVGSGFAVESGWGGLPHHGQHRHLGSIEHSES